jgi:hypothetical protein
MMSPTSPARQDVHVGRMLIDHFSLEDCQDLTTAAIQIA